MTSPASENGNVMRSSGFLTSISFVLSAFALFVSIGVAAEDETLDTSKLPRVSGTNNIFASPSSTIFTAPGAVAETADGTVAALKAAGWQPYAPLSASRSRAPPWQSRT